MREILEVIGYLVVAMWLYLMYDKLSDILKVLKGSRTIYLDISQAQENEKNED